MRFIAIFFLLGTVVLACLPGSLTLAQLWSDFANLSYSHGFAVAAVCCWLIFRDRREIDAAAAKPSWSAMIALAVSTLAWIVFWKAGVEGLYLILMPVMAGLMVYAVFGREVALRLAFPLMLLYTAFPAWEWLITILQRLTVVAVSLLLKIVSVPASVQDTFVILPTGTFEIAGGCAGLHFFVVGMALAALLGELDKHALARRVALLAIMAGIAMLANWIRVFVIILAGHFRGMNHYLIHNHYLFGWIVFAVGVAFFLLIGRRYFPQPVKNGRHGGEGTLRSPAVFPIPFACAIGVLAVAPLVVFLTGARITDHQQRVLVALPEGSGAWSGPQAVRDSTWRPVFTGANGTAQATYHDGAGRDLEVFAAFYGVQSQGAELIGYGNSVLGTTQRGLAEPHAVDLAGKRFLETVAVDEAGARSLVWYGYEVAGHRFVQPLLSQLWYGLSSLAGEQPSALLAFRTGCEGDCREARVALSRFAADMDAGLLASIRKPETRAAWVKRSSGSDQPPPAGLQRALAHMKVGRYAAAEAELDRAQHLATEGFTPAHYAMLLAALVESRLAQGKLAEAQESHRELAHVLPDAAPTKLLGARLLIESGQTIDGVSELRRLTMSYPDYLPGRLILGRIFLAQGNLAQAEGQLRAILERVPEHPEASLMLQQIRLRSMRPEEIDNPLILNNLAWLYFEQGDPRAEALARRAYELAPKNAAVLDTYGWILLQKKDINSALHMLAAAAHLAPGETEIVYHHAVALVAADRPSEARPVLARLVAAKGEFARRKDAEQLLRDLPP